jgi:hypothetical protein
MYSTASSIQNENVQDSQMTLRVTIKFKPGAGANALVKCASQRKGETSFTRAACEVRQRKETEFQSSLDKFLGKLIWLNTN